MRKSKPKEIKINYHYVGDDGPEQKAEAEKRLEEVFDSIFRDVLKKRREKKAKAQP